MISLISRHFFFHRFSHGFPMAKDGDELVVFSGGEGHMGATLV